MNSTLSHLRLADLELFITASHLKSLSKAAVMHHMSQSAASAAVQRVEAAFVRELCTHEKKQFRLTQEGAAFVIKAEEWLRQLSENVLTDAPRPIRLATTQAIARVVVPAILPIEPIELHLMRPDRAYEALLRTEADIAFVPDNAPWSGVVSVEIGVGSFQLFSKCVDAPFGPVLLPENQIEVLTLMQRWNKFHKTPLEIKARIPSWSLIADICSGSSDVGFLPDFLANHLKLKPVSWQPEPSGFRILAIYQKSSSALQERLDGLISKSSSVF